MRCHGRVCAAVVAGMLVACVAATEIRAQTFQQGEAQPPEKVMQPCTAMLGAIGVADQLELYGEAHIVKEGNIPPPVTAAAPPQQ